MPAHQIQSFFKLTPSEKRLFIEAFCKLGLFRIAIACISFAKLTRPLSPLQTTTTIALSSQQLGTARQIQAAIKRAANHTPWKSACLVQALCAQRMLKKRKIPGTLHLGVMKEGTDNSTFKAHAWIECNTLIICGAFEAGEFQEISVLSWMGQ